MSRAIYKNSSEGIALAYIQSQSLFSISPQGPCSPTVLLDMLYIGAVTKHEVERQSTGSLYARYRCQIEDIWAKRLQNLAAEWREEMVTQGKKIQVIWIFGPAGTGKTRLAKQQADKANQPP